MASQSATRLRSVLALALALVKRVAAKSETQANDPSTPLGSTLKALSRRLESNDALIVPIVVGSLVAGFFYLLGFAIFGINAYRRGDLNGCNFHTIRHATGCVLWPVFAAIWTVILIVGVVVWEIPYKHGLIRPGGVYDRVAQEVLSTVLFEPLWEWLEIMAGSPGDEGVRKTPARCGDGDVERE